MREEGHERAGGPCSLFQWFPVHQAPLSASTTHFLFFVSLTPGWGALAALAPLSSSTWNYVVLPPSWICRCQVVDSMESLSAVSSTPHALSHGWALVCLVTHLSCLLPEFRHCPDAHIVSRALLLCLLLSEPLLRRQLRDRSAHSTPLQLCLSTVLPPTKTLCCAHRVLCAWITSDLATLLGHSAWATGGPIWGWDLHLIGYLQAILQLHWGTPILTAFSSPLALWLQVI